MANEIAVSWTSGLTLYCLLRNTSGQVYNTGSSSFETYAAGSYSSYAITLAEQGATGYYLGSVPAGVSASGRYTVQAKQQAGGSPAASDQNVASGSLRWNGTAEVDVLANTDKTGYSVSTVSDKTGYSVSTVGDKTGYSVSTVGDKTGYSSTVTGYAAGQDPATLVLVTAANKLQTNASGQVQHDMTQAVPTSNTGQTVGDALNAARAQGFGRWVLQGVTLQLFAADGTTLVRQFVLDSALNPTSRT